MDEYHSEKKNELLRWTQVAAKKTGLNTDEIKITNDPIGSSK